MPLITVLAGSQGWECGISLNNQDCRIKTRRQEQRGHTAAICAAAVVGGSGRGGCAGGAVPIAQAWGAAAPRAAPARPCRGLRPGAFTSAPPQALPEPRRGRRLRRGRVRKWLLKNQQRLGGARPSGSERRWGFGMGVPVPRPGRAAAPSGEPGGGRGQRPQLCAGEGAVSCPLWGRAGLSGGFASPFLPKERRGIAAERRFLKQMEANLVLLHSGLHQPLLENLPRVSEAEGFASVVPLLLSFSLTQ